MSGFYNVIIIYLSDSCITKISKVYIFFFKSKEFPFSIKEIIRKCFFKKTECTF